MVSEAVTFPADDLALEGVFHRPTHSASESKEALRYPAVAVCHPHPLYGGDMHNSVVVAICEELSANGFAALRFNFRGVGGSEGSSGGGVGEESDARAALDFLGAEATVDSGQLCLAGYSFGALVALSAVDERVRAVVAVSPPLGPQSLVGPPVRQAGMRLHCPALFVFGGRDAMAPADRLSDAARALGEECQVVVVPDADHFWWGQEDALAREVVGFFRRCTGLA
jgi:alpha/beta superfamily hydrolase